MADLIGQQFGNYRLTSLLGSGGFAEVYLGEHVRLSMQAAIKVLHARLVGDEGAAFQEEARTIAELIHPNIIRVLDFDLQDGTPFLVLDYAAHGSLRQRHKRGERLSLEQVVVYLNQAADALQYAHDRKHIHRDVKPENMLVGRQGEILLTDFGIASIAHSTSSMRTEAALGTLAYMAPEQIQGRPRPASDQYALAIVAYQWLSGTLPFRGSSAEVIGQQLSVVPPPLHTFLPDVPSEVGLVVTTALAKDPHERFPSIQTFANAFAQAVHGEARSQSTVSYSATTVGSLPTNAAPPASAFSAQDGSALRTRDTPAQTLLTGRAASEQRATSGAYLQPGVPYSPPSAPRPRSRRVLFFHGLTLGLCTTLLVLITNSTDNPSVSWFWLLPFFLWGMWTAGRVGTVRSSLLTALTGCLWAVVLTTIVLVFFSPFFLPPFRVEWSVQIVSVGLLCLAVAPLGGVFGRGRYRARQPIHPPAGGSIQ